MSRRTPRVSALHLQLEPDGSLSASRRAAPVLSEEPLEIRLIDGPRYRLRRTPGHDIELAHGLLYAEGLIACAEELSEARYCAGATGNDHCNSYNVLDLRLAPLRGERIPPPERGGASISQDRLTAVLRATPTTQPKDLHRVTALREDGHRLCREDFRASNAVDKVVGALLLGEPAARHPAKHSFLILDTHPTLGLLRRAQGAGFLGVCAPCTPTGAAVEYARAHGLVLLHARESPLLYSGEPHP